MELEHFARRSWPQGWEADPPPQGLRSFAPPTFSEWEGVLTLPVDPAAWIDLPDGFQALEAPEPAGGP